MTGVNPCLIQGLGGARSLSQIARIAHLEMPMPQINLMSRLINYQWQDLVYIRCNSLNLPGSETTRAMFSKLKNADRETAIAAFMEGPGLT
jgi:hypothetical protein